MFIISIIIAGIMYLLMIVTNIIANALPINNITTGDVALKYPNLFQPSSSTFSIWGIIYLLLLVYMIYQIIVIKKSTEDQKKCLKKLIIYLQYLRFSILYGY